MLPLISSLGLSILPPPDHDVPMARGIRHCVLAAAASLCVLTVGCSKPYQEADVDGVLIIHDVPAPKVRIQFIPDVDKHTLGPPSMADTDTQGHFILQLHEPSTDTTHPGAIVGWHRVVLSDLQLSESETGRGVPIRFGPEYTLPGATPMTQEVKEGKQTIELKLP